ncbi:hypothetical protein Btru_075377 [Bulinus truncatus]|nr:hypothetical protein Btru_075377 [Bulinus truncatus]
MQWRANGGRQVVDRPKLVRLGRLHTTTEMLGHNYHVLSAQGSRSEIPTMVSAGVDLYRASFSDPEVLYEWSDRAHSLSEILTTHQLPLVVKLFNDNTITENDATVDLQQPLLLFREIKGRKLHARNIKVIPASHDTSQIIYQTAGPYIIFPETYPGLFKDLNTKDHHLLTIADVTRVMPKSFLSHKECDGFLAISQLEGELFQKTKLPPGLYRPLNVLEDTVTYVNKRKSQKKKLVRCLRCEDERAKNVLFPLETQGVFYLAELNAAFTKTSQTVNTSCRIYRWTEFDSQRIKHLRARLMHGSAPQQECQFTGLLEFNHVTEEHSVVVSTMTSSPRLFEMAVTSEPFFTVALNSKSCELGAQQQKCMKFAKLECDDYVGKVKVKKDYGIDEVVSQT